MVASFEHNTVNAVFVQRKDSCCSADTVTLGNSQNNTLNGFPAIIGVHKDCVTIFRESLIAGLATQQMSFVLAIPSTSCNVSATPEALVLTLRIRTKIIGKIYHSNLLSDRIF